MGFKKRSEVSKANENKPAQTKPQQKKVVQSKTTTNKPHAKKVVQNKPNKEQNKNINNEIKLNSKEAKKEAVAAFGRYTYYKEGYLKSLGILIFTFITLLFSLYTLYYTTVQYTPPKKYFPVDNEYRLVQPTPLNEGVMTDEELQQFVADITKEIFEYNYRTADKHGLKIKKYFLPKGYKDFMAQYQELDEVKIVKKQGFIIEAKHIKPPQEIKNGLFNDRYKYWEFEINIEKRYISHTKFTKKNEKMIVLVMRRPKIETDLGMGIFSIRKAKSE